MSICIWVGSHAIPWDRSLSRLQLSLLAASRRYPQTLTDILHIVLHLIILATPILRCIILVIRLPSPTGRANWYRSNHILLSFIFKNSDFPQFQRKGCTSTSDVAKKRKGGKSSTFQSNKIFTRALEESHCMFWGIQKNYFVKEQLCVQARICILSFVFLSCHYPHWYPGCRHHANKQVSGFVNHSSLYFILITHEHQHRVHGGPPPSG